MLSYKKLRILLAEKGIDWKTFREMCTLTPRTVKKIKSDDYVDLETLEKICIIFQVNIGDIMDVLSEDNLRI